MSRAPGASWWLAGIVGAVVAVVGGAIGWGQLGPVKVPRSSTWAHPPPLCPDSEIEVEAYASAVDLLERHEIPIRPMDGPCDRTAGIHIRVDAAEVERLYPTVEAMGEFAVITGDSARGVFVRRRTGSVLTDCTVYLRYGWDTQSLVHELLHCHGWDHPRNPPSGHVLSLHYERMGLEDWRGIGVER